MGLAPDEGVHASHGGARQQPQPAHPEPARQQQVLRPDHVVVVVPGKPGPQPVAGLGRLSVADSVGKDDEIARRVQRAAGREQDVLKLRPQELPPGAARAVQDHHRIDHLAAGVAPRPAQRGVVQPQLGERLAGGEPEVPGDEVALVHRRSCGTNLGEGFEAEHHAEGERQARERSDHLGTCIERADCSASRKDVEVDQDCGVLVTRARTKRRLGLAIGAGTGRQLSSSPGLKRWRE